MPGKLRRSRRGGLEEKRWRSLEEQCSARLGQPLLARSRTCDPPCRDTEPAAVAAAPLLSERVADYCKAFGALAERDTLLGSFSCAWQREVLYRGHLYISSQHVCFCSSLLLKDIKVVVPVASISALKKTNTALLVPNALSIRTAQGEKFLFVSLRRREDTYQLLKSVCKHLPDSGWSTLASPNTREILRKPLVRLGNGQQQDWEEADTAPAPLAGTGTDAVAAAHAAQTSSQWDPEQSTPEPDSFQEPPDGPSPMPRQEEEEEDEAAALALSHGGPHTALGAWTTAQLSSLNTILLIYLLLVVALLLSSGYMGLRLLELEQQLAAVGAWPDLDPSQQFKTT
ncbi:GRAM domain-containing protein 2-like protein [Columba livia]|nr:GRAM domain-containing protein 2-like protein [Columba livia]